MAWADWLALVAVAFAALALAGCATAPAGALDREQEDWLREATVLVKPHVERITGVKLPPVQVVFHRWSWRACASAGGNEHFGRIRYFKSCPLWRRRGYEWLRVVAHELVHVADRAKHKGMHSKAYGKGRYDGYGPGHGPWWASQFDAVMQQAGGKHGWAIEGMAKLPLWPLGCDKRDCCTRGTGEVVDC